jgi:hypothetical protein
MLKIFLFKGTSPVRHSVYEYKGNSSGTYIIVGGSTEGLIGARGDINLEAFNGCEELI